MVLVVLNLPPLLAQQAGSLEPSFLPGYGVDGSVDALATQNDGKVIVAGRFSHVDGQDRINLARLDASGQLDASFVPPVFVNGSYTADPGYIKDVAVQPDGRLLVGGTFTKVGGVPHADLVRLNPDGTVDASFMAGVGRVSGDYGSLAICSLAVQSDGKLVIAGGFSSINDQPRRGVARLNADGSLDTAFDPSIPANVYPAQGLNGDVAALALGPDGGVYVAGGFTTVNGVSRPGLARLRGTDGNLDAGFAPDLGSYYSLDALACQPDGDVLVAGYLKQPDKGKTTSVRRDLARFHADGSLDEDFSRKHGNQSSDYSNIKAIAVQPQDGAIVAAGSSLSVDGVSIGPVGRYLADGSPDNTFYPGVDPLASNGTSPTVSAIALCPDGTLVVGGEFDAVDGAFRHHLTVLRGSPSADCPVVMVKAAVPTAVASNDEEIASQDGKFSFSVQPPAGSGLDVHFEASSNFWYWLDHEKLSTGLLPIKAGKRKGKLLVHPNEGSAWLVGNGKSAKVRLRAGRGYTVGAEDHAKIRVIAVPTP